MTAPTPEAIEAAEAAVRKYYSAGGWVRTADVAKLAVQAAYPLMEAHAKAETLREAADAVEVIDPAWDSALYVDGAYHPLPDWLRARAATLEGKDS